MPQFDEKHVKLCGGIVVWDGVTRPEVVQQGAKAGSNKWSLKVVFEPHNQDVALFDQLANQALAESKWRGQLPGGGRMPISIAQAHEFGGNFAGWPVISFKTTLKAPDVYDENGAPVDPMQLAQLLYTGQKVDVLAHCYEYDAAGNKGISAGLDAFALIVSAQAPRLNIGGGINTAGAFGGGAAAPQQAPAYGQQSAYGAPAQANPQTPAAQPYGQPAAPANGYAPAGGATPQGTTVSVDTAGQNANAGYTAPNAAPQQAPAYGAPAQAHNFLPGQG